MNGFVGGCSGEGVVDVAIRNGVNDGQLNEGCGAEFVHKHGKPPQNFQDKEDRYGRGHRDGARGAEGEVREG
jgi:hypothetical protein